MITEETTAVVIHAGEPSSQADNYRRCRKIYVVIDRQVYSSYTAAQLLGTLETVAKAGLWCAETGVVMFNFKDDKWPPGFGVGHPFTSQRRSVNDAPVENPYFPGLAGMFRIPSLPGADSPTLPLPPGDNSDESIQPVRKPIKCSGPTRNVACR